MHTSKVTNIQRQIIVAWNNLDVLGRIYVASEGINAQLSLPNENFSKFQKHLNSISFLRGVAFKYCSRTRK